MDNYPFIRTGAELAQNIRHFRKKSGLTQKEVAKKLFISRSSFAYYETGRAIPNVLTLVELARIFNVPLCVLLKARTPSIFYSSN